MVLEEGLDISSLPETLKEDFDQLDRLEGQYRVTSYLTKYVVLEEMSPEKGPPCGFCNVKDMVMKWAKLVEDNKPMYTFSRVILRNALRKAVLCEKFPNGGGSAVFPHIIPCLFLKAFLILTELNL